jgi:hypothetical protein
VFIPSADKAMLKYGVIMLACIPSATDACEHDYSTLQQATLLNLVSSFHLGKYGRPLSSLVELGELLKVLGHPSFRRSHWSRQGADDFTDAIDTVLRKTTRDLVQSARFLSATLDEVTTANGQGRLSIHLYWSSNWALL